MNKDYNLGYKKGKSFVRDNIIAMLVDFQFNTEDKKEYEAYEKVMANIQIRFGKFGS